MKKPSRRRLRNVCMAIGCVSHQIYGKMMKHEIFATITSSMT